MSTLPSASSGTFSVLPLVPRSSTESVLSISFNTAEYAAPYTWKPPPGVAVPSTTVVFSCAAALCAPAPVIAATATAATASSRKRWSMVFLPLHWLLIGARAGRLDHASPLLGFRLHEFAKLLVRTSHRLRALIYELRAQLR